MFPNFAVKFRPITLISKFRMFAKQSASLFAIKIFKIGRFHRYILFGIDNVFFIIHHLSVIGLYQLFFHNFATGFVYTLPPDFTVAIPDAVFLCKMLIAAFDMIFHRQRLF